MATFNVPMLGAEIKPVPQTSLADMLGIARGAQAYQQAQQVNPLALQQQQQAARTGQIALSVEEQKDLERKNLQYLIGKEPQKLMTDGVYDPLKATSEILKIAPLTGMAQLKDIAGSFGAQEGFKTAETGTQSAQMDFANKQVLGVASRLTGLINNPLIIAAEQNPNEIDKTKLEARVKKYAEEQAVALGIPKEKADQLIGPYLEQAATNPAGLRQFLKDKLLATLDQGSRLSALQPSGVPISTGAQTGVVQTGQFGPYAPGAVLPGTLQDVQVPPTTEITNPQTGEKRLIGPMSQRNAPALTTGLGPAQTSLLGAGGASISEDFKTTMADARDAQPRITIFQNIKKFAPDSFTGVGGQRKELAAGILNAIGIPAYEAEKISTEELAKNSALLALAGGNTDAARALAEVATPNKKLNEKAILAIADQMIGIEKMKVARANFLSPVQNDAGQFAQRQQQFNSLADPRLFQEMSREDVEKLRKSMTPAMQAEMSAKIKQAKQLGIIP
jgi:hypothetical protein